MHPEDRVPGRIRLWSLTEDVLIEVGPGGTHLVAFSQWGEVRIDGTSPVVCESLLRLGLGPMSVENLPVVRAAPAQAGGPRVDESTEGWRQFERVLDRLGNCVVQSLGLDDEGGPVLSVVPVSRQARFERPPVVAAERPVRLSRFAAIRAGDGELVVESPVASHRVVLHRPTAVRVVGELGRPRTVADLATRLTTPEPVLTDVLAYLVAAGVVVTAEPNGPVRFAEDDDPGLVPWAPSDLQFHAHSRMGQQHGRAGPPVRRPPTAAAGRRRPDGPRLQLHRPAGPHPPYPAPTELIEISGRHGDYAADPVTAEQLGELLFRAVGGTDLDELELYVSADRCVGLPRGSYSYHPGEHALGPVNDSEPELVELLDLAKVAAGSRWRPPVLITATTQIARLSWLHSGMAYAATLQHVGAVQQNLTLVATAMGLASTALAGGEGAIVDEALRLDWPTEVSIGEFIIGARSRRPGGD